MPTYEQIQDLTHDATPPPTNTVEHEDGVNSFYSTLAELVAGGGAVLKSLFDANTILKADSDDTPAALTVAEQTILGRITGGVIAALTAAQVRTLLNIADGATANPNAVEATSTFGTDNRLLRSDLTARLAQASGITVDDSDNLTGLGLINSQRIPDGAGTAATGTTHSATSADDNRVVECSNASGCTVSVNSGTAGSWRGYFASAANQTVTITRGTLTTLYIPPNYDQGSTTIASDEQYSIVGVFFLSASVGIAFGRMATP